MEEKISVHGVDSYCTVNSGGGIYRFHICRANGNTFDHLEMFSENLMIKGKETRRSLHGDVVNARHTSGIHPSGLSHKYDDAPKYTNTFIERVNNQVSISEPPFLPFKPGIKSLEPLPKRNGPEEYELRCP